MKKAALWLAMSLLPTTEDKMYYAFAYDTYYPRGGVKDLIGFDENLDRCINIAINSEADHKEVWGADEKEGLVLEWSN